MLAVAWLISLKIFQTLDPRILGAGAREYSRVLTSCFAVFGLLAILDLLFRLNIARGFLAIALPVGTIALVAARVAARNLLYRSRNKGNNLERLLIVGSIASATPLLKRIITHPHFGYRPVGICTPLRSPAGLKNVEVMGREVPVFDGVRCIGDTIKDSGASAVAVSSSDEFLHEVLRELSWELEASGVDLLVAPGVADVAGPRMTVRQVEGLPLLHIDKPRYDAAQSILKLGLDYLVALTAILLLSPVMVITAIAIKLDDKGPVFFRHTRVGKDGQIFEVWKFRSMTCDVEKQEAVLRAVSNEGAGVFYKSASDPRITRVGRIIRKTSVDEIPQLFNVLKRDMSLVGPRPLVPGEGSEVPNFVERRLLVKPGITGLWQVSGRSDLPEEDRIRLDLIYVENWSLMQDLAILWRTVKAVLARDGAY